MIKPNELRIGNIIRESNSFTPAPEDFNEIIVASINDIDKVVRDNQENGYSFDMLYGIPLTEEWLGRIGFAKNKFAERARYEKGNYLINYDEKDGFYVSLKDHFGSLEFGPVCITPDVFIKHVHQLQNLYFALTGEELIPL